MFEIPAVNQTQVVIEEREKVTDRETNVNVIVTNERGMELLHLLNVTNGDGPVRDVGPALGILGVKQTEDLAETKGESNREDLELSVQEVTEPEGSVAKGHSDIYINEGR